MTEPEGTEDATEGPIEIEPVVANLKDVSLNKLADHEGDTALEKMLERLKKEVETPREPVSGFASAV